MGVGLGLAPPATHPPSRPTSLMPPTASTTTPLLCSYKRLCAIRLVHDPANLSVMQTFGLMTATTFTLLCSVCRRSRASRRCLSETPSGDALVLRTRRRHRPIFVQLRGFLCGALGLVLFVLAGTFETLDL